MSGQILAHRDRFDSVGQLDRLRAEEPVARIELPAFEQFGRMNTSRVLAWLLTRYDDVRKVLGDPGLFSSVPRLAAPNRIGGAKRKPTSLLASDPPEHTRLRRMLAPEFTVNRVSRMQPRIEEIVAEALNAMEHARPPLELVQEFAEPVSLWVMCEMLGMSRDDGIAFQRVRREATASVIGEPEKVVTLPRPIEHWNGIAELVY
jgi:cytochrome P450